MDWKHRYIPRLGRQTRLQRKLHLAFGFFFLCPVAGLIFFGIRYNLMADEYVPYFFLGLLVFAWLGFSILKGLFERITAISASMAGNSPMAGEAHAGLRDAIPDELRAIVDSFQSIRDRFGQTARQLEKKSADISVLKDLSELCYVTFDPEEILYIALERALLLTASDIGSVLSLERRVDPKVFTVKATIGLGSLVKPGDCIDFDTSIAKYAVLNKSPLLVENIEQDKRFGRANLDHYGAKSFVCMPIKTSQHIIGVLTISSRDPQRVYSQEEVEALTPLLGNAAFTFENLRLLHENERHWRSVRCLDRVAKLLNSSFRDGELLNSVLHELHGALDVRAGAVLVRDDLLPGTIQIRECFGFGTAAVRRLSSYVCKGSLVEKALQEEASILVETPVGEPTALDEALFGDTADSACCLTPLRAGGSVFGALLLVGRSRERLQDSQTLVNWVAGGIALAVERNRLLAALAKRDQEMETIRQVGGALASSTFDMDKVLTYTMDMIHEVMNAEAGSLLFLENGELEVAVAFNGSLPSLRKFRLKLGQGIAGCVAARGEAIIVNDMEKSLQFFPVIDVESGFRTRSALCVPMISQGRVIGVIEVLNKVNGPFDANDRDLLQALATSVCIALENARLYKETVAAAAHERDVRRMFQKFVPKEVVDKIVHGPDAGDKPVIEEVKRVTLLNIDIRGFSRISRQMGPQRTVALLNRFFASMGEVVFRYRGIVDKYLGDGFLAVFGAPVSGPEDADNAVTAALEMRRILAEENAGMPSGPQTAIHMGISVHTGEVVVGNIGFEKKMDYTVIGEAVNTVFRMQGLLKALPDGILISDTTLRAVQSNLSVAPLETSPEVQHEFGPLTIYELTGSEDSGRRVRTGRPPAHADAPAPRQLPAGSA
jgi:class 3 adenylate cyclase/putative methionine-R-sulfoxide reductase with GAF domain